MGNIHVKLYEIWTSGSGDVVQRHFLSRALTAPLFSGLEPFVQYWKKDKPVKLFRICTSGSGGNALYRYFLSGALASPLFSRA